MNALNPLLVFNPVDLTATSVNSEVSLSSPAGSVERERQVGNCGRH